MNPTYDFRGQVALVTGASSGMGLAAPRAFAQAGTAVALADVNEPALESATDDLTSVGHRAMSVVCDVSDEDQVAATVEQAVAQFGRLDMAFDNAGIMVPPTNAAEEPSEQFDRVNAVDLRGVWACMKHEFAPDARAGQRGRSSTTPRSAGSSDYRRAPRTRPASTASSD